MSMGSRGFLLLSDDIIDRIFTFLTDFKTLAGLILVSKSIYTVFQSRPNSIIKSICHNIIGPAWPQALRMERYGAPLDCDDIDCDECDAPEWPNSPKNPWSEKSSISAIKKSEVEELIEGLEVVQTLEDIFARRHKDRTGTKLSPVESWRFRRALYRFWLYTLVFQTHDFSDDNEGGEGIIDGSREMKFYFLNQFPSDELKELYTASIFFVKLLESAIQEDHLEDRYSQNQIELGLAVGPSVLLDAYEGRDSDAPLFVILKDDLPDSASVSYITQPLFTIWEERGTNPPCDESHWRSILNSSPINEREHCQRCGKTNRFDLWNKTNWEMLQHPRFWRHVSFFFIERTGILGRNTVEKELFKKYIFETFDYRDLMTKIHRVRTAEFGSWNDEDWLCTGCSISIANAHLQLWLLEKKREDGILIPSKNCRHGYWCKKQTHEDLDHYSKYNAKEFDKVRKHYYLKKGNAFEDRPVKSSDLVFYILTYFSDFDSLRSTILASKSFYAVFEAHPNSIIKAICYNVVGVVLPQALDCLPYKDPDGWGNDSFSSLATSSLTSPLDIDSLFPITRREGYALMEYAMDVEKLEYIFDSTALAKLDGLEPQKFRGAIYRLELFSKVFPSEQFTDDELGSDFKDEEGGQVDRTRAAQVNFLNQYTTTELQEIHTTSVFLRDLVSSIMSEEGDDPVPQAYHQHIRRRHWNGDKEASYNDIRSLTTLVCVKT
ncbi:hypothetical protein AX16_008327 [Volvariella volvacea WC 439]|nr:hypothetical protein AX16_008327 [Volvariella volvacea WC 439]